jgi:reactive intermediate/imine deaminase
MMKQLIALSAFFAIAASAACARPASTLEMEFYPSPRANAVFSPAVRSGNVLFLSGQIGTDTANRLVPGGLQVEARQALNNIKRTLEQYGSSMDRVAKCTVFLADIKDYADFNEIYVSYFRARKPARSAMAASGLALGARVEIECIGFVGLSRRVIRRILVVVAFGEIAPLGRRARVAHAERDFDVHYLGLERVAHHLVVELHPPAALHDGVAVDPGVGRVHANRAVEALADSHQQAADVGIGAVDHRLHER